MCSASSYELVLPPAPKVVVRPTTLGACQVRLQLSTLLLPKTALANFDARKLTSFVDLEQLKIPVERRLLERLTPYGPSTRAGSEAQGRRDPAVLGQRATESVGGAVERFIPCGGSKHAVLANQRLGQATIATPGVAARISHGASPREH